MKKALKILGIVILIVFLLLLAIPFAFQSQIKDMVKNFINQNLNAHVEFSDVSLSLIRSFPQAHVNVDDLVITNFEPFKDETFATAKNISFTMSVKELFKKADEDPIVVNSITVDEALLTLKTDKFGNTNYDLAKKDDTTNNTDSSTESSSFSFDIEDYSINSSALTYLDEGANTEIYVTELNHSGKGTFSAEASELDTKTEANVSLSMDSTKYLNNNHIKLDALIGLDLNNQKYTFKDNKGYINQLPLEFKGYVQMVDEGQEIDITFENPQSSFKDFLAVIPETYSKNIDDVETSGDFKVSGVIKGLVSETTIPTLDISILSNNASFKYPDLPKRVENITIDTAIKNTTGNVDDTFVAINTLNFKIDQDVFKSSATIKNITKNMMVNANLDGTLNLSNITKAYPIELENELSGILKGQLNTAFDMEAIEKNQYERIKNNGSVTVSDFIFSSEDIVNPIHISKADVTFNPGTVSLNSFNAKTGESDLNATGTIKNLIGFLLSDKKLQGNFNVNSNYFAVSDFMVASSETEDTNKTTPASESLKIPDFLDCTINANAKTVVYDNLNLKDVKGALVIKDQEAKLQNLTSSIFDGILAVTGNVSTKADIPTFNLSLGADSFDISKSFKDLQLLQSLAPIAKALQGKLNTTINLAGSLDKEFSPKLSSISGDAFAELLTTKIDPKEGELLSKLEGALNFVDFSKLNLNDIKAQLKFENGNVTVKPFKLSYQDIGIEVSGSHSFEKTMSYNAVFNVPAKYLGSDVNRLIGKINDNDVNKITIPVTANITGSYTSPKVSTDLTSGVSNLTKQLIEIEKQKLLNSGKDKVNDLLGNLLGGDKNTTNETTKDSTATKTDTTTTKDPVKEGVKSLLNGLIKNRKKTDSTKQQ
ncbi:AsmA family protein [Meridianimaribacter sp. CL38]|uniref:AsmA-like C-terminal region-containing protein n=1 Tax=Meridianimaribacter sp. CL38 TaxID=2213021 RepID=UPI0010399CAF|nr:AsmA-like C-terminal region-containing protein [Meridianimaribacter sp. CL38]TBV24880.1 AsmA family protein [Meridianimaribacter sp. CL38]